MRRRYNALTLDHPKLGSVSVPAFQAAVAGGERWDVAVSFSSFDHDGLGRCVKHRASSVLM